MTSLIKIGLFLGITLLLQGAIVPLIKKTFKNYNPALVNGLAQIARLVIALVGLLLILNTLGLSLTSLITISGIGAAAIAFAGKGVIGNFFGGLLLYINRPFTLGEKISSPDRSIEGVVEEMGWMLTMVRDAEQRPIYIPNGIFTDIILINLSRRTNLRILTDIGLRYEDAPKIEAIIQAIKTMVKAHPGIDQSKTNLVSLNKLLESSLNINLNLYTTTTDNAEFATLQQGILLKIMAIIEAHEAACAYPSRSLYHINLKSDAA